MFTAFDLALEYTSGMITLVSVMKPEKVHIDDYCQGLLFGENGFHLIMKLANFLRALDKDADFDFIKKPEDPMRLIGNLAGTIMGKI